MGDPAAGPAELPEDPEDPRSIAAILRREREWEAANPDQAAEFATLAAGSEPTPRYGTSARSPGRPRLERNVPPAPADINFGKEDAESGLLDEMIDCKVPVPRRDGGPDLFLQAVLPYTRKNGTRTLILEWRGTAQHGGLSDEFVFLTPLKYEGPLPREGWHAVAAQWEKHSKDPFLDPLEGVLDMRRPPPPGTTYETKDKSLLYLAGQRVYYDEQSRLRGLLLWAGGCAECRAWFYTTTTLWGRGPFRTCFSCVLEGRIEREDAAKARREANAVERARIRRLTKPTRKKAAP